MYRNLISFPLDHIINSDEILLKASKDGAKVTRLEAHYKAGSSDVLDDSSSIGSLTPFVSAAGTLWLLVFCLKITPQNSKKDESSFQVFIPLTKRQKRSSNSVHDILIFGNTTGLLNSELWNRSVKKLISIIRSSSSTERNNSFH